ncbi:MAG: iron uptake porin, partial [Cyanobium sp.]
MKLFQQLLVAPAALGLLAPFAANAADLNLSGVNQYASKDQVNSINKFSDVNHSDWAYQALSNLIERYGCVAGYPDGTYRGQTAMTRYEAAALLNACLDRITEITDELKKLMKEFEKELAVIRGRVDGLEAKVGELEATQFSTTTKLQGQATFVIGAVNASGDSRGAGFRSGFRPGSGTEYPNFGNAFNANVTVPRPIREIRNGPITNQKDIDRAIRRNSRSAASKYNEMYGATSFNYDFRLNFITSFTGKDQLYTRLRTGNFSNAFNGNGVNLTALDVASNGFGGVNGNCGGNRDCS